MALAAGFIRKLARVEVPVASAKTAQVNFFTASERKDTYANKMLTPHPELCRNCAELVPAYAKFRC